jgi:hypothetical protein
MARSFMFFGTARTSVCKNLGSVGRKQVGEGVPTSFRKLHKEELFALFGFGDMGGYKGILKISVDTRMLHVLGDTTTNHERLEVRPPPLRKAIPNFPVV